MYSARAIKHFNYLKITPEQVKAGSQLKTEVVATNCRGQKQVLLEGSYHPIRTFVFSSGCTSRKGVPHHSVKTKAYSLYSSRH